MRRKWEKCAHLWPMHGVAGGTLGGWPGWPGNKKFALVLTHDIETGEGIDNVLRIADLEEGLGFRSVFNFVADEYYIPPLVLDELRARGFEIGVHGLYHNSLLYHSRDEFLKQAPRINQVLKEWGAVGFRSPCMYHNLDWLHDLEIRYDASTFDMDPFEPQPDGVSTIFPLFITDDEKGSGYVELPYTLPQDFTLFILMRNKTTDIWKEKLEWIAHNGGMALMVTHPDYMRFEGQKTSYAKYDADHYREFLYHVISEFSDQYWNALPSEAAGFWANLEGIKKDDREDEDDVPVHPRVPVVREEPQSSSRRPLNVCMVAYTFYEEDARVRRYAEALANRGDMVDVVALKHNDLSSHDVINGVNVYRIQGRIINEKTKLAYLSRIVRFLIRSTLFISVKHFHKKYDIVHVHSVPDFEVFAALLPKITGAKIILDIHDIVPEFYAAKFKVKTSSYVYRALKLLEKISVYFSNHVIISNHLWESKLIERSVERDKCTTFMNYPDKMFFRDPSMAKHLDKFVIMYPGSLNWHQGLDIAIRAFHIASKELPNAEFHIYGSGQEENSLRALIADLDLNDKIIFKRSMSLDLIAEIMAGASLGIVPKRNDEFGGEAFSTKVLEFMALGVPIVLSKTKIDSFYFNDSIVQFFEPDNHEDLAECILSLAGDEEKRSTLARNASDFVSTLCWDKKKNEYFSIVDRLTKRSAD